MKLPFEIICFILSVPWVSSSISGKTFMDPIDERALKQPILPGEDPCNPLYWYPRHVPDYCYGKKPVPVPSPPLPIPPLPIPLPYPIPPPMTYFPLPMPPFPPLPPFNPPPLPFRPLPPPFFSPPLPPYSPPQMPPMPPPYMPYPGVLYPPIPPPTGLVPGIPGIVSPDGGINILPFSDAYSDMLEKYKQKKLRKRLQKVLDEYDDYPRKRKYRKHKGRIY